MATSHSFVAGMASGTLQARPEDLEDPAVIERSDMSANDAGDDDEDSVRPATLCLCTVCRHARCGMRPPMMKMTVSDLGKRRNMLHSIDRHAIVDRPKVARHDSDTIAATVGSAISTSASSAGVPPVLAVQAPAAPAKEPHAAGRSRGTDSVVIAFFFAPMLTSLGSARFWTPARMHLRARAQRWINKR